jgi:hypothetical protein
MNGKRGQGGDLSSHLSGGTGQQLQRCDEAGQQQWMAMVWSTLPL